MRLELPLPIERYFASKDSQDVLPLAEYFAIDATVRDNGEDLELRGLDKIDEWMSRNSGKYKLSTELKSVEQRNGVHVIAAVVSGDFPGSPYEFSYRFTLRSDKIEELTIDPIGPVGASLHNS
ncbi:MAG: hypothetical protein QOJ65_1952 [Fimbriimonadaceae bacterium]|jgi:hypothetical protein|nr:hypothetical protein [Fimbriimonadaceae bacterium]